MFYLRDEETVELRVGVRSSSGELCRMEHVSTAQLERAARALRNMQLLVLVTFAIPIFVVGMVGHGPRHSGTPEMFFIFLGLGALGVGLMFLIQTYRCAANTNRSGMLWLLLVMFFKWLAAIVLCYKARKWLQRHDVKVTNLGFSFQLPDDLREAPTVGFNKF